MKNFKQKDFDDIAGCMNSMHRKIPGCRTAAELFQEQLTPLCQRNAVPSC